MLDKDSFSLLPDGQIFCQITHNRLQKLPLGKKSEAVKSQNLKKLAEKRPENMFAILMRKHNFFVF
jgi:hypothetical protein